MKQLLEHHRTYLDAQNDNLGEFNAEHVTVAQNNVGTGCGWRRGSVAKCYSAFILCFTLDLQEFDRAVRSLAA